MYKKGGRTIAVLDYIKTLQIQQTDFMKKLIVFALLIYMTSCSNPEDKATGNPDSTSFNKSGNDKNLNTPGNEIGNQSKGSKQDTFSSPATMKENANSPTQGTNRSYKAGGDSAKKR